MPAISGREDGKLFKYIDNSGQGGFIDYRLSAYDMTPPQEAGKVWEKVKSAEYRGEDTLPFTEIVDSTAVSSNAASNGISLIDTSRWGEGDIISLMKDGVLLINTAVVNGINPNIAVSWNADLYGTYDRVSGETYTVIHTGKTSYPTSGNFSMLNVIGPPENILQVEELKNGWIGGWIPVITGGESPLVPLPLTRKEFTQATTVALKTTFDGGITWTVAPDYTLDPVTNEMYPTNAPVAIVEYAAFSKQTKVSSNKPVLGGSVGIGDVFTTEDYKGDNGNLLCESTLGLICKENTGGRRYGTPNLLNHVFGSTQAMLFQVGWEPKHMELTLPPTDNDSSAMKALPYQISNSGLLSLGIHANELHYDTTQTDWGDDSLMKITNSGTEVFTDLNGNDMIQTVHELSIPYGYSHNRARISVQQEGVDL